VANAFFAFRSMKIQRSMRKIPWESIDKVYNVLVTLWSQLCKYEVDNKGFDAPGEIAEFSKKHFLNGVP